MAATGQNPPHIAGQRPDIGTFAAFGLKQGMVRVGDVKTFKNFVVAVPESVDPARYNTVIVWCETFSQFITAARYR